MSAPCRFHICLPRLALAGGPLEISVRYRGAHSCLNFSLICFCASVCKAHMKCEMPARHISPPRSRQFSPACPAGWPASGAGIWCAAEPAVRHRGAKPCCHALPLGCASLPTRCRPHNLTPARRQCVTSVPCRFHTCLLAPSCRTKRWRLFCSTQECTQ